ncbi:putative AraC-type regulatory protein, partial [Vibrio alginolyticus 12G01]
MPNIEIIRFNHFTARKSERYTATHNGLYIVE